MAPKEITNEHSIDRRTVQAIAKGEPFRFSVPEANLEFVVLKAEVYDRLKSLFSGDDVNPDTMYPLLAEISPEDWEDPSVYGIGPNP